MPDRDEKQLPQPQRQQKTEDQFVGMSCSCGETFLVPLAVSGNPAVCPHCKSRVRLPEENFVRIICSCGKPFKVPAVLSGRTGICPQCGRKIRIPEKPEETACGAAFTPPLGCVDYKDTLSDDQLDAIGEILLTSKLKTNRAPSNGEAPVAESPPASDAPTKKAEDFYARIDCSCGKNFIVPAALLHGQIRCPQCHNPIKLPENSFLRMHCSCGTEFKVPAILAGKYGVCPSCKKRLKISENKV